MHYFMTGASGWIGTAVVEELRRCGIDVSGLARSDASANRLESAGVTPIRGSLDDLDVLTRSAAESDGVIHLGFDHEAAFQRGAFAEAAESDRRAVEAMGRALAGSSRPLAIASGVAGLSLEAPATELDGLTVPTALRDTPMAIRHATSLLALSLSGIGVRSLVIRFAPTVHGAGDAGFINTFVQVARQTGESVYVGDGENRWPALHISDAGRIVRASMESAPSGSVIHAVGEEGVPFIEIARSIGRQLAIPVRSIDIETALSRFGFLGSLAAQNLAASATLTQELLNWSPTGPTLLEDIDQGSYTH